METFLQDFRYGARMLLKKPGFTFIAVAALALGIGANSAIFSVVNAVLLRPLRYDDPDRLAQLWESNVKKGRSEMPASYPNFADWRGQNHVFEEVIAYADWSFNLTGVSEPERIQSAIVSAGFFSTLGIRPIIGRVFLPEEDKAGNDLVVVISERLWRRRFNADPNITGTSLNLGDKSFTVVGVIEQGSQLPLQSEEVELWAPLSHGFGFDNRSGHYLSVIARLKPGITLEQAQAEMDTIAGQLAQQYPDSNTDHGVRLVPLHEQIVGNFRPSLLILLGAVAFILLIASANVANMLLARAAARQKEMALRIALGAGRSRIMRQLLTESILLSLVSGIVGLLIALWGLDFLIALSPADLPRAHEIGIDTRVLGFTFAVSLLTGVVFGTVPALQSSRPDLNETLKEGSRSATSGPGRQRIRNLLVVSEVALSLMLLIGAGLLIKSFVLLRNVDPGFNARNVLTMQLDLSGPNYKRGSQVIAFHDQLLERVRGLPGVQSAGTRSFIPMARDRFAYLTFAIGGRPVTHTNRPAAFYNAVSTDYFRTMGIPLLKGRDFDEQDVRTTQNVVIVNETLARRYFPDEEPVGKRLTLNDENPKEEEWATVVGVVGDTKPRSLDGEPVAEMYMPYSQQPEGSLSLMVRVTDAPQSVAAAIRNEVQAMDSNQPVHSIRMLDRVLAESVSQPRFRTYLLGVFAAVALTLAAIGIYGVMSYSVTQRTHEIGIRIALGAKQSDVLRLVVGHGFKITLIGVAIGLAASFALTRAMSSLLYAVSATDPLTFILISLILTGVALGACAVPALRATKVDPMVALRYE